MFKLDEFNNIFLFMARFKADKQTLHPNASAICRKTYVVED